MKRALAKFWNKVREMLDLPVNGEPGNAVPAWERFVNSAIGDFYRGVNPNVGNSSNESSDGIRFRMGRGSSNANSERLTKQSVEQGFGGIWIDDKQEFAKFTAAVNNYAFEENGEGIAYTDNYFYAYYLNIDGQAIPYAAVYLNEKDSQDVVKQINQEIEGGKQREGIK